MVKKLMSIMAFVAAEEGESSITGGGSRSYRHTAHTVHAFRERHILSLIGTHTHHSFHILTPVYTNTYLSPFGHIHEKSFSKSK